MIIPSHFSNQEIAEFLANIGIAYQITGKSRFEIIAYENAAETIKTYPQSAYKLWQQDPKKLDAIPNVGEGIIKKLNYLFARKKLYPSLRPIFKSIHPAVFVFTKINGVGPKNAYKLTRHLTFSSNSQRALKQLIEYCQQNKIKDIPGFGEKSQNVILANALSFLGRRPKMAWTEASQIASEIISYLKIKFPKTEFIPLGSLRRQSLLVGDIDIAAKSSRSRAIFEHFTKYPLNLKTVDIGSQKASITLKNDIRIDIMAQPSKSFGALLQHFTGSRQHNILLRRYALKMGYSLSEYGIKSIKTGKLNTFKDETSFYHFLRLAYIPPSDRIGEKEIENAQKCYTKSI
ncbi:MAG: hypothetical protein WC686_03190 [Candidatus Shapirobacteria bacterium]|jgi:DNA polymerase (family 10)